MKAILAVLCLTLQLFGAHSLIIPDELPSLLSLIYSNIPTIKKGTDSRVGWGFRLGDRADFQILLEIGPQTNTQPLANQGGSGSSKRDARPSLRDILKAQRQAEKKIIADTTGGKWINDWRESMKNVEQGHRGLSGRAKPGLGLGEIDAKSVIPDDSVLKLEELYEGKQKSDTGVMMSRLSGETKRTKTGDSVISMVDQLHGKKLENKIEKVETTIRPKTSTSAMEALDNVDMK